MGRKTQQQHQPSYKIFLSLQFFYFAVFSLPPRRCYLGTSEMTNCKDCSLGFSLSGWQEKSLVLNISWFSITSQSKSPINFLHRDLRSKFKPFPPPQWHLEWVEWWEKASLLHTRVTIFDRDQSQPSTPESLRESDETLIAFLQLFIWFWERQPCKTHILFTLNC